VSIQDFYREFHLGLCLGSHKNIVSTYDVAFETSGFYVFTQEYAPLGKKPHSLIQPLAHVA
jgi:serine/threonine-protein kinase SBK